MRTYSDYESVNECEDAEDDDDEANHFKGQLELLLV